MKNHISNFIKNKLRFLENKYSHELTKKIENIIRKMFYTGEIKVKHIGNNQENNKRAAGQKISRLLQKEDFRESIEDFSIKALKNQIDDNTVIAYDLTDIAKPYAKKMEKISQIFDGSKRQKENGYFVHGLGIKNGLLALKVADQDSKFLPTERQELLEKYIEKLNYKGIWVFDRGNDDQKLFKFLNEKKVKFIVRLKSRRKVKIKIYDENSENFSWSDWFNLEDLPENNYEIKIKSGEEYRLIISKNLKNKASIKLITNIDKPLFNNEKLVNLYLNRWCIEMQFKSMKTKFSLEEIQVQKFQTIQNLTSLVHLTILLSQIFWQNLKNNSSVIWCTLYYEFESFCREQSLNFSFDSATFFLKSKITDPFSSFFNLKKPHKHPLSFPQLPLDCDF